MWRNKPPLFWFVELCRDGSQATWCRRRSQGRGRQAEKSRASRTQYSTSCQAARLSQESLRSHRLPRTDPAAFAMSATVSSKKASVSVRRACVRPSGRPGTRVRCGITRFTCFSRLASRSLRTSNSGPSSRACSLDVAARRQGIQLLAYVGVLWMTLGFLLIIVRTVLWTVYRPSPAAAREMAPSVTVVIPACNEGVGFSAEAHRAARCLLPSRDADIRPEHPAITVGHAPGSPRAHGCSR